MQLIKKETRTLYDLPNGSLFLFNDTLCLKSEYRTTDGAVEAYIVGSGEMFWGGTLKPYDQIRLIVTRVEIAKNQIDLVDGVPYIPFPTAFHTVDILATKLVDGNVEVLLGRKHNKTYWVFIGGFVEPKQTAESAALRELHEETNVEVTDESRLIYLGSHFIDDSRYKESCHKITTSIFTLMLTEEEAALAKGGDDIAETKWVPLENVCDNLAEHHKPLYEKLIASKNLWLKTSNL